MDDDDIGVEDGNGLVDGIPDGLVDVGVTGAGTLAAVRQL